MTSTINPPLALQAENLTSTFLQKQGWLILGRRFRRVGCELDIVAKKGATLIIVEVKWRKFPIRSSHELAFLLPKRKLISLKRGAQIFIAQNGLNPQSIRFDLAIVTWGKAGKMHIDYRVGIEV